MNFPTVRDMQYHLQELGSNIAQITGYIDLSRIEYGSEDFLRLRQLYNILFKAGAIKDEFEDLFVRFGKQQLQQMLVQQLRSNFSSVQNEFFAAIKMFYQTLKLPVSRYEANISQQFLLNGHCDVLYCYFALCIFCRLNGELDFRQVLEQMKSSFTSSRPPTQSLTTSMKQIDPDAERVKAELFEARKTILELEAAKSRDDRLRDSQLTELVTDSYMQYSFALPILQHQIDEIQTDSDEDVHKLAAAYSELKSFHAEILGKLQQLQQQKHRFLDEVKQKLVKINDQNVVLKREAAADRDAKERAEDTLLALQRESKMAFREKDTATTEKTQIDTENKALIQQKIQLEHQILLLQSENDKNKRSTQMLTQSNQQLQADLDRMTKEVSKYRQILEREEVGIAFNQEMKQKLEFATALITKQQTEYKNCYEQFKQYKDNFERTYTQHQQTQFQLNSLKVQLEQKEMRCTQLEQENKQLDEHITELKIIRRPAPEPVSDPVTERLEIKIQKLQQENEQLDDKNRLIIKQLKEKISEIDDQQLMIKKLEHVQKEKIKMDQTIIELEAKCQEYERIVAKLNAKVAEGNNMAVEVVKQQQIVEKMQVQYRELDLERNKGQITIQQQQQQIIALQDVEQQKSKLDALVKQQNVQVNLIKQENNEYKEEIDILRKELAKLREVSAKLAEKQNALEDLQQQNAELAQKTSAYQKKFDELQTKFAMFEASHADNFNSAPILKKVEQLEEENYELRMQSMARTEQKLTNHLMDTTKFSESVSHSVVRKLQAENQKLMSQIGGHIDEPDGGRKTEDLDTEEYLLGNILQDDPTNPSKILHDTMNLQVSMPKPFKAVGFKKNVLEITDYENELQSDSKVK